jgi:Lipocalin-like domain
MPSKLCSAAVLALVVAIAQPVAAEDLATSIVGAWKLSSFERKEVASGKIERPYGERPIGQFIFTRGGHSSWFITAENRKPPASPQVTDAERVDLFKTMAACSQTYKVVGNKVVETCNASWNQLWTGMQRANTVEIKGNTLTVTTPPYKTPQGVESIAIVTWERAE